MASALGLVLACAGGLFEVAIAAGEPAPLPPEVGARLLAGVCDVLEADSQIDCGRAGTCRFRRSDGAPFVPHTPDWWDVHALPHAVATLALGPAAALLGGETDADSGWEGALGALSGTPWRRMGDGGVMQLSPWAARWAEAQLPTPETPMCGVTAGEVYHAAFRTMLRRLAATWLQLKRLGEVPNLSAGALARSLAEPRDVLTRRCEAVARTLTATRCEDGGACGGAVGRRDTERSVRRSCRWWLRRHASLEAPGGSRAVRTLLAAVLDRYDPGWFKARRGALLAD